ncbi:hypothetical protein ACFZDK_29755 [Streptomyces sp. NPDC007901]|uniref:hypothetical protein n=1 Tax=Streptomyces sp. NPDC007901 TaxID=3364785 RepID=UPI0036EC1D64
MDAELTALAAAGATTFVQQMAADTWAQSRDHIVSFFSRRGVDGGEAGEGNMIGSELEASRRELAVATETGDEQTASDVEAEWRMRLRRVLAADPAAASALTAVLAVLRPDSSDRRTQKTVNVHNVISGGVQNETVIQAGNVDSINFGSQSST